MDIAKLTEFDLWQWEKSVLNSTDFFVLIIEKWERKELYVMRSHSFNGGCIGLLAGWKAQNIWTALDYFAKKAEIRQYDGCRL